MTSKHGKQMARAEHQNLSQQAVLLHRSGKLAEAEALYLAALAADARDVTALHLLGVLRAQQGRLTEALEKIDAAHALQPGDAEILLNRANVLKSLDRPEEALADYDRALTIRPDWPQGLNNRGTVLQSLGRFEEALADYQRALTASPNYVEALNNRGSVLEDLKRPAEALTSYDQALRLAPHFAAAFNNRGSALLTLNRFVDALSCFDRALALRPGDAKTLNNRGNALLGLSRHDEALAAYDQALALRPDYSEALNNRGNALQSLKRHEEALASFDRAGAPEATIGAAMAALDLCDWARTEKIGPELERRIKGGEPVPPWTLLGYSEDESLQRQCAANAIRSRFALPPPPLAATRYGHDRIRLAYVSSDIGHHPVTTQLVELIEAHDRKAFEVIGVGTNADDGSAQRRRLVAAFDRFVDAHQQSQAALAAALREMEIDILVDLNGHTKGDHFELLSHRPAPVQANWLGYAGTTAAPFVDFLIADTVVAPDPRAFSEKLALLPHCFFPSDTSRRLGPVPTRQEAGLPDTGFVFCCFNNSWKLTAPVFARWMSLLRQVPGSVLWLKRTGEKTRANLLAAAESHGVAPQRLIFAGPAALEVHLARHQLADLFLDTAPYGAHATACDALWAGLPVLTRRGSAYASRVAASFLTTMGLAELITESWDDYEALALVLARDPARLASLKQKLVAARSTTPLFDTPRLARDLEALYRTMLAAAV
jgi:predicted O-linked N-acetylglucosamine transferase (SPINDLY family)